MEAFQEGETTTMVWEIIIGVVGIFGIFGSIISTIFLTLKYREDVKIRRNKLTAKTLEQIDELVECVNDSYKIELDHQDFTFEQALQKYKKGDDEKSPEFQHLKKVVRSFEPVLTKLENIESLLQAKSLDEKLLLSRTGGIILIVYQRLAPTVLEYWDMAHSNVKDEKERPYYKLLWTDVKKLNKRLNEFDVDKLNKPSAFDRFISFIKGFWGAQGA